MVCGDAARSTSVAISGNLRGHARGAVRDGVVAGAARVSSREYRGTSCEKKRVISFEVRVPRTEKRKNGLPNLKSRRTQRKSADKAIVPSCRRASNRKDREAPPHRD